MKVAFGKREGKMGFASRKRGTPFVTRAINPLAQKRQIETVNSGYHGRVMPSWDKVSAFPS